MRNKALNGVRSKIDRAVHHFEQLQLAVNKVIREDRDALAAAPFYEYRDDRRELIVFRPTSTPIDPSLSLIIGDCIHNTRSALDHLVFQLAILNKASKDAASRTSFPVCLSNKDFRNATKGNIKPFISGRALAAIKKTQPYSAGGARDEDVLWVLSQLDIIDKHRLLIVTKAKFRPISFTITMPSGHHASKDLSTGDWKPSEAGTEMIRFDLSNAIVKPGKVHVEIKTATTIQIEGTGMTCDGMVIFDVLSDCIRYVTFLVDGFGKEFFGE